MKMLASSCPNRCDCGYRKRYEKCNGIEKRKRASLSGVDLIGGKTRGRGDAGTRGHGDIKIRLSIASLVVRSEVEASRPELEDPDGKPIELFEPAGSLVLLFDPCVDCDPVDFPGLPGIVRERLFKTA